MVARRILCAAFALTLAWVAAGRAQAQPAPAERSAPSQFATANIMFVLLHELGHAAISEFQLPVLGREEDAADTFATLSLLYVGTDVSHRVLTDTARGLMYVALRDKAEGRPPAFYSEHGLDPQRAYQIVCLMYGSDPRRFRAIADQARLPPERRESCQIDFELASSSWVRLLEKHARPGTGKPSFIERLLRRKTADGKPRVDIVYENAQGEAGAGRNLLQSSGVMEQVRTFVQDNLNFPRGLTFRAKACGEPGAYWDPGSRSISICYEMLTEMGKLAAVAQVLR